MHYMFHNSTHDSGSPKFVMIAFFAIGVLFVGFSLWALYLTDIPQEQFQEDPMFEEDYKLLSMVGSIWDSACSYWRCFCSVGK